MADLSEFTEIVKPEEPLAAHTHLRLGGPAEALVRPRSREELAAVVRRCGEMKLPLRVLGNGCNVLVRDEGVRGAVLKLDEPAFARVTVEGRRVRAGAGAPLADLIAESARQGLAGLETLAGIRGTVGGSIRCNAGDRSGEIGQFVRRVVVMGIAGEIRDRARDELHFGYHASNLDDPVLLEGEFELDGDDARAIVKRMLKAWVLRRASQPPGDPAAARIFQNPRGLSAAALIEQASLGRARAGGAEVSDRDANYFLVHPGAAAADVLRLIELVRGGVKERFNVHLELEITVW